MADEKFRIVRDGPVARLCLTNPDRHNAFDDELILGLTEAFAGLGADDSIRVVILEAEGKSFSAGADLNWMKRVAGYSHDENIRDASALAEMLRICSTLSPPPGK